MKKHTHLVPYLAAFCLPCLLIAQESNPTTTGATAPALDPNSPDVQSFTTYDLGDRRMVVQEVTEATLPIQPHPAPPAPAATGTKLSDEVLAARKAQAAKRHTLNFGGSVYITADGTCRSLITCHPFDGSPPVVFWSSVDWDLLRVGSFNAPEGTEYILMTMISMPIDIARTAAAWAKRGRAYQAPAIPEFPAGAAATITDTHVIRPWITPSGPGTYKFRLTADCGDPAHWVKTSEATLVVTE